MSAYEFRVVFEKRGHSRIPAPYGEPHVEYLVVRLEVGLSWGPLLDVFVVGDYFEILSDGGVTSSRLLTIVCR
jgi:hypothetical protein